MKKLFRIVFWSFVAAVVFFAFLKSFDRALKVEEYQTCLSYTQAQNMNQKECEAFLK